MEPRNPLSPRSWFSPTKPASAPEMRKILIWVAPIEILIILQGVLILSVVIAYEIVNRRIARRRQQEVRAEETALEGGG